MALNMVPINMALQGLALRKKVEVAKVRALRAPLLVSLKDRQHCSRVRGLCELRLSVLDSSWE